MIQSINASSGLRVDCWNTCGAIRIVGKIERCEIGKHPPYRQFGNAYPPYDGAVAQSMCSLECAAYFFVILMCRIGTTY